MQINNLQNILLKGLSEKRRLRIVYHGEERTVEVHTLGISTKGNPCARVFQVIGGAVFGARTGWKMLKLSDIEECQELDQTFDAPREGYKAGDKGMSVILAEL